MATEVRQARRADIPAIQRIRRAVRENQLVSMVITDEECTEAVETTGRGWVLEADSVVVGFAIGNSLTGNVWALFVDPDHEHRGYGRRLHDEMVAWLWSQNLDRLWLTTAQGTRAERFYEQAGWSNVGATASGELLFEMVRQTPSHPS